MSRLTTNTRTFVTILVITAGMLLCLEAATRLYLRRSSGGILVNQPLLELYPTIQRPEELFSSLTQTSLQWSPYEHWVTGPNLRARFFRTNALGLRGPEISVQKPPGRLRIVVLGGSAAWGLGCTADARTVPGRLEAILREQHPGRDIEVINAGQFAYVSGQELTYYHRVIAPLAPDLVLLFDGYNDVVADLTNPVAGWPQNAADLQSRYEDAFRSHQLGSDILALLRHSRFFDLASRIVLREIAAWKRTALQAVIEPTITAEHYVRNVTALARLAAPAPVWVTLQPVLAHTQKALAPGERRLLAAKEHAIPRYTARVRAAYRAMDAGVRAAGIPMIPMEGALGTAPTLMFIDECHFGDEAADRIATQIAREWSRSNVILEGQHALKP